MSEQSGKLHWSQAVLMAIGGLTLLLLPMKLMPKHALVIDDEGKLQLVKKTWYILWGDTEELGEVRAQSPGHFLIKKLGGSWEPWRGTQLVEP